MAPAAQQHMQHQAVHLTLRHHPAAGQALAAKRRTQAARGYDYFVEAGYVELYNEGCVDLLAGGRQEGGQGLPVSGGPCGGGCRRGSMHMMLCTLQRSKHLTAGGCHAARAPWCGEGAAGVCVCGGGGHGQAPRH